MNSFENLRVRYFSYVLYINYVGKYKHIKSGFSDHIA